MLELQPIPPGKKSDSADQLAGREDYSLVYRFERLVSDQTIRAKKMVG